MSKIRDLVIRAQDGDEQAIMEILVMYEPLIKANSMICGRRDEDCSQFIIMEAIRGIRAFTFRDN